MSLVGEVAKGFIVPVIRFARPSAVAAYRLNQFVDCELGANTPIDAERFDSEGDCQGVDGDWPCGITTSCEAGVGSCGSPSLRHAEASPDRIEGVRHDEIKKILRCRDVR